MVFILVFTNRIQNTGGGFENILLPTLTFWFDIGLGKIHRSPGGGALFSMDNFKNIWMHGCGCGF